LKVPPQVLSIPGLERERDGRAAVKVREVMTPDVEVVNPDDTLRTAAQVMADLDVEALPVSENNHLTGVITGRDIAMRVAAEGCDPKEVTVGQAMTCDALYCFESEPVNTVSQKMAEWWVRRLPVVNRDKCLIGMVSLGDLTAPTVAHKSREIGLPLHRLQAARSARRTRRARRSAAA
jgi:CBS domain-containing protein